MCFGQRRRSDNTGLHNRRAHNLFMWAALCALAHGAGGPRCVTVGVSPRHCSSPWRFAQRLAAHWPKPTRPGDDQDTLHPGRACPAGTGTAPVEPAQPGLRAVSAFLHDRSLARTAASPMAACCGRPSGLDREGPVLKLMFGGGIYHYVSGALGNADVRGTELAAAILPGWRFVRNGFTVTVFLGYDFQRHRLRPDDPSAGLRGSYYRRAHRFRALVSTDRDDDDRRRRISVHGRPKLQRAARGGPARVRRLLSRPRGRRPSAPTTTTASSAPASTSPAFGPATFEWSAGAGWATDTDDRSSAYGKLSVWTRR